MRRRLLFVLCLLGSALTVPALYLGAPGRALLRDDLEQLQALGDAVATQTLSQKGNQFFKTGSSRFDGQSAVAAEQMTLLGLGQIVLTHPELRDRYLPAMNQAAERILDPKTLEYAASEYGHHGAVHMGEGEGHAYLGYINLGLGMLRMIDPGTKFSAIHDKMTEALADRLFASPNGMIDTYPGEFWPPDVAAVAGSIGLHDQATGKDRSGPMQAWARRFEECAVHDSGLLVQRVQKNSCELADAPRGSGTAVAAYFLSFANVSLSDRLYTALRKSSFRSALGYGAFKEYAPGFQGLGDGNSGPVVFGLTVGATGFGLGAARAAGDDEAFLTLFRTTNLFGMLLPISGGDELFMSGGRLGNSLLLAMLTARKEL